MSFPRPHSSISRYYSQSYNLLREVPRSSPLAVYEQKAVAEFFHLKVRQTRTELSRFDLLARRS